MDTHQGGNLTLTADGLIISTIGKRPMGEFLGCILNVNVPGGEPYHLPYQVSRS